MNWCPPSPPPPHNDVSAGPGREFPISHQIANKAHPDICQLVVCGRAHILQCNCLKQPASLAPFAVCDFALHLVACTCPLSTAVRSFNNRALCHGSGTIISHPTACSTVSDDNYLVTRAKFGFNLGRLECICATSCLQVQRLDRRPPARPGTNFRSHRIDEQGIDQPQMRYPASCGHARSISMSNIHAPPGPLFVSTR